ncbi:uncharacterized protein LOC124632654 [Helicoverpa zea]|uniref:uncharacterized protein LOC124632654 n=1 Tax=Helicoverpa zea TaxID=7113 RepID=UPI001F574F29|nr:uncharacterized protein LOC124632654 [Helicoverpa zea]
MCEDLSVQLCNNMASVQIVFLVIVFLVGVGLCQNNATVAPAATTAATASSSSSSSISTSSTTTTQSMFQNFNSMLTAVPKSFMEACEYGKKAVVNVLESILAQKQKFLSQL